MRNLILLALFMAAAIHADENADANANVLAHQCVATFVYDGQIEDVVLWRHMFELNDQEILYFVIQLNELDEQDELPRHLVEAAIASCREIYESLQSPKSEAPSQASGVDGTE